MKKVLALIMVLLPIVTIAQVKVGDVVLDRGKVSTVYVDGKNGKLNWVGFTCPDEDVILQFITIDETDLKKFRTALNEAIIKANEWDRKAAEHGIDEYQHELPVEFPYVKYVWGIDKKYKSNSTFRLWYYKKGEDSRILIRTIASKVADSMHLYKSFNVDFTSVEQIRALLDLMSNDNVAAALEKTKKPKERKIPLWKIFD